MLRYLARPEYVPDGFTANLVRYPLSALFCLPWLLLGIRRGEMRGLWFAALLPTMINIVGQTLWSWAPYYLEAGLMAFQARLSVIWSILCAFLIFRDERHLAGQRLFWIGATLALAGFVAMSWQQLVQIHGPTLVGVTIIFFCSVCWGLYGVSVRYFMREQHPFIFFSVICLYTSIGLTVMAPLGEPASVLRLPWFASVLLVISSFVGIALAHGLYYAAVQRIGVAICEIALLSTPCLSLLISHLVFGETFTSMQLLGGIILLTGAALAMQSRKNAATHYREIVESG